MQEDVEKDTMIKTYATNTHTCGIYIRRVTGSSWMKVAEDQVRCHVVGKAYVQQATAVGFIALNYCGIQSLLI